MSLEDLARKFVDTVRPAARTAGYLLGMWTPEQVNPNKTLQQPGAAYDVSGAGSAYDPNNKNLGGKPKSQPTYYGPNYAALRNAAKANAERQIPILQQNYQNSLGDILTNLNFAKDQAKDAEDLANRNALIADNNQRTVAADLWYYNQQKENNMYNMWRNSLNNQYGSTQQVKDKLMAKTDDQSDQTVINNLKQGLLQNSTERVNTINSINQGLDENNMSSYQQISDLMRQYSSAMSNYAGDFLATQASYNDRQLQDANGNLTQAGWDWVFNNLGLKNDGNNRFEQDYSQLISNTGMSWDEFQDMLAKMQRQHTPLLSLDNLGMVRSIDETNDYLRGQAGRNKSMLSSAGNKAANQVYYTSEQTKRYG